MPQVAMQTPQDLNSMFGQSSAMPGFFGAQQIQQAGQINQQNLASAVQAAQIEKEQNPAQIEEMKARAAQGQAQAGLLGQQTQAATLENQVNAGIPLADRIKAKQAELAGKMSDADIKQHENEIQKWLFSDDPTTRQKGQAAWEQISAVKQEKMKQDAAMAQAKTTAMILGSSRENAANARSNATIQAAMIRAKGNQKTVEQQIQSGKMNPAQAQAMFAGMAMTAQDPDEAAHYKAMADYYEQSNLRAHPIPAPQVNPAAVGGGVLQAPPVPQPTTMPGARPLPGPAAAPPQAAPAAPPTAAPQPTPQGQVTIPATPGAGTPMPPGATQQDLDAYQWAITNPNAPGAAAVKAKAAKALGLPS